MEISVHSKVHRPILIQEHVEPLVLMKGPSLSLKEFRSLFPQVPFPLNMTRLLESLSSIHVPIMLCMYVHIHTYTYIRRWMWMWSVEKIRPSLYKWPHFIPIFPLIFPTLSLLCYACILYHYPSCHIRGNITPLHTCLCHSQA